MNRSIFLHAALASSLAAFALAAGAQTSTGKDVGSTSTQYATRSDTAHARTKHTAHHAMIAHRGHHARHHANPTSSNENVDTGYRAELRHCIEGPAAQKESCLDQAITRHERS